MGMTLQKILRGGDADYYDAAIARASLFWLPHEQAPLAKEAEELPRR